MNTTELIALAKEAGLCHDHFDKLIWDVAGKTNLAKFAELLAKRNAATADYIAYLYRDSNGTLKLAQETPPPDNAFPVFTTNIQFLDVARLVLDDNVDLIIEHGGVKLWEKLVANINATYRSASLPAEQDAEYAPSDAEVLNWNDRHDDKFEGNISKAKCAILDARSMHLLPAIANRKDGV